MVSLCGAVLGQAFDCGEVKPPTTSNFITSGNDSPAGALPWTLLLQRPINGTAAPYCGAVLIDYDWALTSAQCVIDIE